MNKLLLSTVCLCLPAIASAGPPLIQSATTVNFDGYSDPTYLGNFTDSGAMFTATGATTMFEISAFGKTWGTVSPQILCPRTATINCGGDFNVTFESPVSDLKFYFTGDDGTSPLSVGVFLNGLLIGTVAVSGDGVPDTAELIDLSNFSSIDEIKITGGSADANGLGYDDFSFVAGVPEPTTWAMMLLGFAGIGATFRRQRKTPSGHSLKAPQTTRMRSLATRRSGDSRSAPSGCPIPVEFHVRPRADLTVVRGGLQAFELVDCDVERVSTGD